MVYPVFFSSSDLGRLESKSTMGIFVRFCCLNAVLLLLNSGIVVFSALTLPLCDNPPVELSDHFHSLLLRGVRVDSSGMI